MVVLPGKNQKVQRSTAGKMLLRGSSPVLKPPFAALVENQELSGSQGFHHPKDKQVKLRIPVVTMIIT
jgi:hypothetical protein